MLPLFRHATLVNLVVIYLAVPARAEQLTKVEISQRGKAATALVDLPGRGTGTAFCVHPSGLFVTNEHVVRRREAAEIKLIVDAGLETQRILPASVVRADKDLDVALLRVETEGELPSLPLGSVEAVTELMDVVAFGFPLGSALAADRKEYPAISVNAGNVSSLRQKEGELHRIQIDVSVTFGSSGGPVLDERGHVVGVVVSGVVGQRGLNLAIPVSHITRFLDAPDIQLAPPRLTRATLHEPLEFKAQVVSVVPGRKEPSVRLVLRSGDEQAREFPMTAKDGIYVATAVPVSRRNKDRVEVTVRLGAGMVLGLTDDLVLKVGGRPVKLSGVRRIELKPKPAALLADGKTVEGDIVGLGPAEVLVGDQNIKLDLSKALQIQVQPAAEVSVVTAAVVASVDGKEVARVEVPVPVQVEGSGSPADPSSVAITPPALAEEKVVKRLPEPFREMCLGGGGRYFIFHLPPVKRLAVFDINEARITGYIPVDDDRVSFAAGLESLVLGLPEKGVLERWSLSTFERELSAYPPFSDEVMVVLMGHASNRFVVVNGRFLDLTTLRPVPIHDERGNDVVWEPDKGRLVSADGTVFGTWSTRYSPGTATTFVLEGNVVKRYDEGAMGHIVPGPDGKTVFTAQGVASATLKRVGPDDALPGYCLPAVRGNYFLSLSSAEDGHGGSVTLHLLGHPRPISRLRTIEHGLKFNAWDREEFGVWRRIFLVPQANVIVVLPPTNDQLVLHKFDVDAALEQSGLDYLLVTSQPPRTAQAGKTFEYSPAVKARHTPVSVELNVGPPGMEVSKTGTLTWKVPADSRGDHEVILTVRDARGQEVFHTFAVRVVR
ncbi:MAG: serine protease [Planctomycetes bacterium]|nr:serine protease [Planctomycetota bacterium]